MGDIRLNALETTMDDYSSPDDILILSGPETEEEDESPPVNFLLESAMKCWQTERVQHIRNIFASAPKAGSLDSPHYHRFHDRNGLKVKIPSAINTRWRFMSNNIQVAIADSEFIQQWTRMDQKMNALYGEMYQLGITDGIMKPSIIRPGTMVAVFEKGKDHIGRFRRAQIKEILPVESSPALSTIICSLIDEGRVISVLSFDVYLMVKNCLKIPPKTILIRLAHLTKFHGSPALGRHFETAVSRFALHNFRICFMPDAYISGKFYEVELFSSCLPDSINDWLVQKMCLPNRKGKEFLCPLDGQKFEDVAVTLARPSGRVFLRLLSPAQQLLDETLDQLDETFSFYQILFQDQDIYPRRVDQICLGIHPSKKKVKRCRILRVTTVRRDDREILGDCGKVASSMDSIRTTRQSVPEKANHKVVPKLSTAPAVTKTSKRGRKKSKCQVTPGKSNSPVVLVTWNSHVVPTKPNAQGAPEILNSHENVDILAAQVVWIDVGNESEVPVADLIPADLINRYLSVDGLKTKEFQLSNIKSLKSPSTFYQLVPKDQPIAFRTVVGDSRKAVPAPDLIELLSSSDAEKLPDTILNETLLELGLAMPTLIQLSYNFRKVAQVDGMCDGYDNNYHRVEWVSQRYLKSASPLLSVGDCISFYISRILPHGFVIHPWYSKLAFEQLRSLLENIQSVFPWKKDDPFCPRKENFGKFCLCLLEGKHSRAKFVGKVNQQDCRSLKHKQQDMSEVLLIDSAKYVWVKQQSMSSFFPSRVFARFGPQAAVGRWKGAKQVYANVNKFRAVILKLEINGDGLASMVLERC